MKKLFTLIIPMVAVSLASCNSNDDDAILTTSYPATNLVTNIATGETRVSKGIYDIKFNLSNQTGVISTQNLSFGAASYTMTTNESPYTNYYYSVNNQTGTAQVITFNDFKGVANNSASLPINGKSFVVSTMNWYNQLDPGSTSIAPYYPAVITQYAIGNELSVKTIATDALYSGKTVTTYSVNGETQSYENETMSYRFKIDIATNKADLIIYKAKFAATMPIEIAAIVVNGLDVTWKAGTYTITGKNIIPVVYEGTTPTPYPSFVFDSINFEPTNDRLTSGKLSYEVAGKYYGEFTGKYVIEPGMED